MTSAHSHRSATIGSTLVARRAGIRQANSAAPASASEIRMKVSGSVAVTPYRSGSMTRVSANAPAIPSANPASVSFIPCPVVSRIMSRDRAPSAIRTPSRSVKTHSGEQQRDRGEYAHHRGHDPFRRRYFMYHPLHSLYIGDRQGGIELHHLGARRGCERRRLDGGAQGDAHVNPGILRVGNIEGLPGDLIETEVFDI